MLELPDGRIVLGHKGGMTVLGETQYTIPFPDHIVEGRVTDMVMARDGRIWIACDKAGLVSWKQGEGYEVFDEKHGLGSGVYAVLVDSSGTVFVGCHGGLKRWDGEGFVTEALFPDDPTPSLFIRRLLEASDGSIYAATGRHGVFRLKNGEAEQYLYPTSDVPNGIYTLFETATGEIWAGSAAGLYRAVDRELIRVAEPEVRHPVYAITADMAGRIWIGTDRGVLRWGDGRLDEIGQHQGLSGTEVNRDALKLDSLGRVWIGTQSGVNVYSPAFDLRPRPAPEVAITDVVADGIVHGSAIDVDLGVGAQDLLIRFTCSSYIDEDFQPFRTWLEGFEDDWQNPRSHPTRMVRYTNVPAGDYRFHIQALGLEGDDGPIVSSAWMSVGAPLLERSWFRILMLALAAAVLWTLSSAIVGRNHARRLEHEVRQRTRELEESERRVRVESERITAILQSISDGVIALDADGDITLYNTACEAITGREADQLFGAKLRQVVPEMAEWVESLEGRPQMSVLSLETGMEEGGGRWLEVASAPLIGPEGDPGGLVLAFRDVTDRRRAEAEQVRTQKLESLGVLAGGLAHDFNNFLMVITGNTSLVEGNEALDDVDRECLASVISASRRAQTLTEHLLTFAKGGAPHRRPVALDRVVAESSDLALSGTNVIGQVSLDPDLKNVVADPSQIGQVLSNLFINARQAMVNGGTIRVTGHNVSVAPEGLEGDEFVELIVTDEGPGIPEHLLDRVFEPYYTTKDTGSGLGLAIAYSVVARHGGSLSVDSVPGRGTTFTVVLPATDLPEEAPSTVESSSPPPRSRILVLDDEEHVRKVIDRILSRAGSKVTAVGTGGEAVHVFRQAADTDQPFEVAILDLTIPGGMGGREVFEELKAIDPGVIGIVVSGYSDDAIMADPKAHGFAASLSKPFDRQALEDTVRMVTSGAPTP